MQAVQSIVLTLSIFLMTTGLSNVSEANNSDIHFVMMEDIYDLHKTESPDFQIFKDINKELLTQGEWMLYIGYITLVFSIFLSPIGKKLKK